jgi:oxygen-dependent protoporphyrinogen oxidase
MLGGAHDPSAVGLGDGEVLDIVRKELGRAMGITAAPRFVRIFRHPVGIPQYTTGHLDRLARIDNALSRHPGLFVTGNSYLGVAINACIAEAGPLAARIVEVLRRPALDSREQGLGLSDPT